MVLIGPNLAEAPSAALHTVPSKLATNMSKTHQDRLLFDVCSFSKYSYLLLYSLEMLNWLECLCQ